jgi:pSer/pThr/pTyr-binding forkhead associated (FHA) protein
MGKFSPVPEWVANTTEASHSDAHTALLEAVKHGDIVREIALNFTNGTSVASSSRAFRVVGRKAEKCDVVLDNNSVSREHAILALGRQDGDDETGLFVFDLGSAQGTRLNGEYIDGHKRYQLRPGDRLKFGVSSTEYVVRLAKSQASATSRQQQQPDSMNMPPPSFGNSSSKAANHAGALHTNSKEKPNAKANEEPIVKEKPEQISRAQREAEIEAMTRSLAGPIPEPSSQSLAAARTSDGDCGDTTDATALAHESSGLKHAARRHTTLAPAPEPMSAEQRLALASRALLVPLTHQVELKGHNKTVTALSIDHGGARVVSGGVDYSVRLWDFGGMDKHHRSFRSMTPLDGTVINSISHSPDGKQFVVAPAASQLMVYNREAALQLTTAKGDVYIHDMANTKGHVGAVTGTVWHPSELNVFASCGLDGTCRLWDVNGKTTVMGGYLKVGTST